MFERRPDRHSVLPLITEDEGDTFAMTAKNG